MTKDHDQSRLERKHLIGGLPAVPGESMTIMVRSVQPDKALIIAENVHVRLQPHGGGGELRRKHKNIKWKPHGPSPVKPPSTRLYLLVLTKQFYYLGTKYTNIRVCLVGSFLFKPPHSGTAWCWEFLR